MSNLRLDVDCKTFYVIPNSLCKTFFSVLKQKSLQTMREKTYSRVESDGYGF